MNNIRELYKQWLKETNRSGSVITGKSMNEFFDWLEKKSTGHVVSIFGTPTEPLNYTLTTSNHQMDNDQLISVVDKINGMGKDVKKIKTDFNQSCDEAKLIADRCKDILDKCKKICEDSRVGIKSLSNKKHKL